MKVMFLAGLVFAMPVLQQCMGSFTLTNKLYNWNKSVGDKMVSELVFFAMLVVPVYSVTLFVDGVILNAVEFWTGNNPMAMNEGQTKTQRFVTQNGPVDVAVSKNKIVFAPAAGTDAEPVTFTFSEVETSWYISTAEGTSKFMQFDLSGSEPKTLLFDQNGRSQAFNFGERNHDFVLQTLNASRFALAN